MSRTKRRDFKIEASSGNVFADLGIANQRGEVRAALERFANFFEIALDRSNKALLTGQVEQRRGVAPLQTGRNAAGILHARRFPLAW